MLRIELDHRGNGKPGAHVNDVDLSGIDVAAEQTDRDEVAVTTRWRFGNFGRLTFGAKREHPLTVVELAVVSAGERAA